MPTEEMTVEQRLAYADRIAAQYERWSWGEGYQAGRLDGSRDGWRDGYTHGFDSGAEVGAARTLLALQHVLGAEVLGALLEERLIPDGVKPDLSDSHAARTAYTQPAGRREWRGLDNGDRLDGIRAEWDWHCRSTRRAAVEDDGTEL